jgi:hypothetical protein
MTSQASGNHPTGDHRTELAALIARLEQASEPDRKIDEAIHDWIKPERFVAREYTSSIDAALTLVPPHHFWEARQGIQAKAVVWRLERDYDEGGRDVPVGYSTTFPAIALCIAALKALAAA